MADGGAGIDWGGARDAEAVGSASGAGSVSRRMHRLVAPYRPALRHW